jgi:hypothetical protein
MSTLTKKDDLINAFINVLKTSQESVFILEELTLRINTCISKNNNSKIQTSLNDMISMFVHHKYNRGTEYSMKLILKNLLCEKEGITILEELLK